MVESLSIATARTLVAKIAIVGLKKLFEDIKDDYEQHLVPLTKHFEHYLKSAYERHSVVNTLVLRNSKCRLSERAYEREEWEREKGEDAPIDEDTMIHEMFTSLRVKSE